MKSSIRSRTLLHEYIEWQRATAFFHLRCVRDDDLTLELHAEFSSEVLVHWDYRILILGPKNQTIFNMICWVDGTIGGLLLSFILDV